MNTPLLTLTVGLPRSGKSTWARERGVPVVNPDSIRLAMHGQAFYAPAEPLVWAHAHLMVSSLFKAGHDHVILDATNVTEHRRREWRSKEWRLHYTCFDTPEAECIRRAEALGQHDLVPIIKRMARDLEWPQKADPEWTAVNGLLHPDITFLHYR